MKELNYELKKAEEKELVVLKSTANLIAIQVFHENYYGFARLKVGMKLEEDQPFVIIPEATQVIKNPKATTINLTNIPVGVFLNLTITDVAAHGNIDKVVAFGADIIDDEIQVIADEDQKVDDINQETKEDPGQTEENPMEGTEPEESFEVADIGNQEKLTKDNFEIGFDRSDDEQDPIKETMLTESAEPETVEDQHKEGQDEHSDFVPEDKADLDQEGIKEHDGSAETEEKKAPAKKSKK